MTKQEKAVKELKKHKKNYNEILLGIKTQVGRNPKYNIPDASSLNKGTTANSKAMRHIYETMPDNMKNTYNSLSANLEKIQYLLNFLNLL